VNEITPAIAATPSDPKVERERTAHCHNCGAPAPGKYCPECGQETRVALPTVRELMRDAAGRLVAIDGRLWRTLYLLLFRPGMLTTEYLRGRRKSYVRPARLFFVMSLLMFAVIRLVADPVTISVASEADADAATGVKAGPGAPQATQSDSPRGNPAPEATIRLEGGDEAALDAVAKKLPAELRKRIDRFKQLSLDEKMEHINSGVLRYAPYAMVVLLPVFALLQHLAYLPGRRRHPHRPQRYAEHLVYGAHLHAFAFLMIIAMLLVPRGIVQVALGIWIVFYLARSRKKVYDGSWLVGFLRSFSVGMVYLVLLGLVMAALVAIAVAVG
jgi:hypothetical protein